MGYEQSVEIMEGGRERERERERGERRILFLFENSRYARMSHDAVRKIFIRQILDRFVFIPTNAPNTHVAHLQRSFVDSSRLIPDPPSFANSIRSIHRGKQLLCPGVRVWKEQPSEVKECGGSGSGGVVEKSSWLCALCFCFALLLRSAGPIKAQTTILHFSLFLTHHSFTLCPTNIPF